MEPGIPGAKTGPPLKVMKSTFVGTVIPVTDENIARSIVKEIKAADRKARHVTFAFRIAGNPVREGMSDDGEPHGTGGMPILLLLRNGDLTNILVTVTRHWGGIKLGPGNLKRAYRDAAKSALDI